MMSIFSVNTKTLYFFLCFNCTIVLMHAQTAGINYQALILDETTGQGNQIPLSVEDVNFRFSITGDSTINFLEYYSEEQTTTTDEYGLIALIVGEGVPTYSSFESIIWDGTPKYLNVEIDIVKNGEGFVFLDSQKILYLPQSISNNLVNASNGLSMVNGDIELGGVLTKPTIINTSTNNTISITGLENTNDLSGSKLIVIDENTGTLKQATATNTFQERQELIIATAGQTQFTTPLPITNAEKVNVYRNGVRIGFDVLNTNVVRLENGVVCHENDEIRIVQLN